MNTFTALVTTAGVAILTGLPLQASTFAAPEAPSSIEGTPSDRVPNTSLSTGHDLVRTSELLFAESEGDLRFNQDRTTVNSAGSNGALPHTLDTSPRLHAAAPTVQIGITRSTSPSPSTPKPTATPTVPAPTSPAEPTSPGGDGEDESIWTTMLTLLGFFIVSMTGLILFVRAGLRSSDDDANIP